MKKQPWLKKDAILAVQDKKRAWKKYCTCKSKQNYQLYVEMRNKATKTCRIAKMNFEKELVNNIKTDSKSFWSYIPFKSMTKSGIADLVAHDGTLLTSDIQKADLLNRFFVSVFTDEDLNSIPDFMDKNNTRVYYDHSRTDEKEITETEYIQSPWYGLSTSSFCSKNVQMNSVVLLLVFLTFH